MSSPSEPEEMVSISIERSFLPSFITEPLPNWRSIWESAAESALVLSMEDPSTIRRAVADMGRAPYGGDSLAGQTGGGQTVDVRQCTLFVPGSQYVLFERQLHPYSAMHSAKFNHGLSFWLSRGCRRRLTHP